MLFIFDWDGTVCDSAAKIIKSMQKSAQDAEVEILDDEKIRNIIGLGLPEAVQALYPGLSEAKQEQVRKGYSHHWLTDSAKEPTSLFPGAHDTLLKLKQAGFYLAIATGKSRKGLNRILDQLEMTDIFDDTRCADETASKPHPLMLEELLSMFDMPAQQAVMVGDTEYDMEMAQRINMPRIAVSYGAHHINRLKAYEPQLSVDSFVEISKWRW